MNEKPRAMDRRASAVLGVDSGDGIIPSLVYYPRKAIFELTGGRKPAARALFFAPVIIFTVVISMLGIYRSLFDEASHSLSITAAPSFWSHSGSLSSVPDKAVVLASYEGQSSDWLHTIPPDWKIYRYVLEGREPYAYLSYIIDNYDALPRYIIFLHGHQTAWHQIEPAAWKIRALNLTSLDRQGYINLRCTHDSGCTEGTVLGTGHPWIDFKPLRDTLGNMMNAFWETYMGPYGFGEYPIDLAQPCCAQFAVSREAVLARPREFYTHFRSPLEWTVAQGRARFGFNWDKYHAGTLYEYLWHRVFGQDAVYCPSEEVCRKEYFSDAIACEKYPGRYQSAFGWRNINCTSIYQLEQTTEEVSRVVIDEIWGPTDPEDTEIFDEEEDAKGDREESNDH